MFSTGKLDFYLESNFLQHIQSFKLSQTWSHRSRWFTSNVRNKQNTVTVFDSDESICITAVVSAHRLHRDIPVGQLIFQRQRECVTLSYMQKQLQVKYLFLSTPRTGGNERIGRVLLILNQKQMMEMSASRDSPLYPLSYTPRCPVSIRLDGPQSLSGCMEKKKSIFHAKEQNLISSVVKSVGQSVYRLSYFQLRVAKKGKCAL